MPPENKFSSMEGFLNLNGFSGDSLDVPAFFKDSDGKYWRISHTDASLIGNGAGMFFIVCEGYAITDELDVLDYTLDSTVSLRFLKDSYENFNYGSKLSLNVVINDFDSEALTVNSLDPADFSAYSGGLGKYAYVSA